jgi:hypothetical protein
VIPSPRKYRAGETIDDYCRVCKTDRAHTVVAVNEAGQPLRVSCGYCRSDHQYRGGPRIESVSGVIPPARAPARSKTAAATARTPFPIVSERERHAPVMTDTRENAPDLEMLLRRVIREEAGITAVVPADKWRGGTLILRPGTPGLQEKSVPIETFFHKIVMLRNRLRTLEQQVNASELPDDAKVRLQAYISGCYGSLTTFNVLFADEDDQFKGSAAE